jgi:hypothetical protein
MSALSRTTKRTALVCVHRHAQHNAQRLYECTVTHNTTHSACMSAMSRTTQRTALVCVHCHAQHNAQRLYACSVTHNTTHSHFQRLQCCSCKSHVCWDLSFSEYIWKYKNNFCSQSARKPEGPFPESHNDTSHTQHPPPPFTDVEDCYFFYYVFIQTAHIAGVHCVGHWSRDDNGVPAQV